MGERGSRLIGHVDSADLADKLTLPAMPTLPTKNKTILVIFICNLIFKRYIIHCAENHNYFWNLSFKPGSGSARDGCNHRQRRR